MDEFGHDPADPEAETVVLRRVDWSTLAADVAPLDEAAYARLRAQVVNQIVSTGDRFGDYEIIEIVPPDEPAFVRGDATIEFV